MCIRDRAIRSNNNLVVGTIRELWYKGSGGLKDCGLDDSDTTSGWTSLYYERTTIAIEPSDSDLNTIQGKLPSDNKDLFPDSGPDSGTSLIATVVTE